MNIDNPRQRRRRPLAEINVVPYIDVMLVLLVIFMITAPLLTQGIQVDLPTAGAKTLENQEPIVVSIDRDGQYYLNIATNPNLPLTPDTIAQQVKQALHTQQGLRNVLVKGDQHVDYGKVVTAMVLLQGAGVANVGLMTHPMDVMDKP
jgi:biopolymer transport protein TolR